MQLQEEEDGWGGSFVNKQTRKQSQAPWSRSSDSEQYPKADLDTANGASTSQAATQSYERGRDFVEDISNARQEVVSGRAESPELDQAGSFEAFEAQEPSPAEQALEAEVLGDADWEASEEDWEEGSLPDITPLAPDEAVRSLSHATPQSAHGIIRIISAC